MDKAILTTQTVCILVSVIATVFIAIYAIKAHKLSIEIKKLNDENNVRDKEFKKELKKLYKAIVISNLPCAGASTQQKLNDFKEHFKDEKNNFEEIF